MLKKVWASMLAVVILTALCLVPASAKSLEDYLIADFDFSTESYENQLDNMKFTDPMESVDDVGTIEFVQDEELGTIVARFEKRAIQYALDEETLVELTDAFTFETYVNVSKAGGFGLILGTFWYGNQNGVPNSGAGICTGTFGDASTNNCVGAKNCLTAFAGKDAEVANIAGNEELSYGQWVHLVYVHEGDTDYFYVNGVDMSNGGSPSYGSLGQKQDMGFRIGGYNLVHNFDVAEMSMAFCKVYATAVSADEVQALYTAVGGQPGNQGGNSTQPSASNSSGEPSGSKPSAPVQNTQTFDLGLVSLAAVTLSSVVTVKKRRK